MKTGTKREQKKPLTEFQKTLLLAVENFGQLDESYRSAKQELRVLGVDVPSGDDSSSFGGTWTTQRAGLSAAESLRHPVVSRFS